MRWSLGVLLLLAGCSRGPTSGELFQEQHTYGLGVVETLSRVKAAVDAAQPAVPGGECRGALTWNSAREFSKPTLTGNTELVELSALSEPVNEVERAAFERERRDRCVWGVELARAARIGPFIGLGLQHRYSSPTQPELRLDKELADEKRADLERAKGVTHLLVYRTDCASEDAKGAIDVFLVEVPAARVRCAFRVEGSATAGTVNTTTLTYAPGQTASAGFNNKVRASAIANTLQALDLALEERFGLPHRKF